VYLIGKIVCLFVSARGFACVWAALVFSATFTKDVPSVIVCSKLKADTRWVSEPLAVTCTLYLMKTLYQHGGRAW
jgi:hypothetical protein